MIELKEELLESAKQGDELALSEVLDVYKNFVYLKARRFFIFGADKDDVIQEGMIGLLKAIRCYDKSRFASFNTFANLCVKRQIITAIKKTQAKKNMSFNNILDLSTVVNGEINKVSFIGGYSYVYTNPEEACISKEDIKALTLYLKKNLSDFEFEVFQYVVKGFDYRYISKILSKKLKSVDNAIQRIRRKSECWLKLYNKAVS